MKWSESIASMKMRSFWRWLQYMYTRAAAFSDNMLLLSDVQTLFHTEWLRSAAQLLSSTSRVNF